jgi:hypothetical protein
MTRVSVPGDAAGLVPGPAIRWVTAAGDCRAPAPGGQPRRRLRHLAGLAWTPAEAVLAARDLSNLVAVVVTLGVAVPCAYQGGLDGVIVNLPGLAVAWAATYGLIRLGRWWRGVYPPEHVPVRSSRPEPPRRAYRK